MPKPGGFSREVPIATQNDSALAMRLKVHAIASAAELGNFSLRSSQLPPLNAFVRMDELQKLTGLGAKQNLLLVGEIANPNPLLANRLDEVRQQGSFLARGMAPSQSPPPELPFCRDSHGTQSSAKHGDTLSNALSAADAPRRCRTRIRPSH